MERNLKAITALLIATMFMVMVTPVAITDESSALTDDYVLSLDSPDCVIYCNVAAGSTDNQHTFTVSGIPANYSAADVDWEFRNLDDGFEIAKFADNASIDSGETATVYAKSPGSIEVVAFIPGTAYIASALVVVFNSPGTHASTYHFYVKVEIDALALCGLEDMIPSIPAEVLDGGWHTVHQPTTMADSDFNALSAFRILCQDKGWQFNAANNGWIDTFLGLGTYSGTDGAWIYWTQYHLVDNEWVFNNTTMAYIDTVDSSYVGMFFRNSTSPTDVPDYGTTLPEN